MKKIQGNKSDIIDESSIIDVDADSFIGDARAK